MLAWLLGASGMGISGLLMSSLETFSAFGTLGVDKSGVKEISYKIEKKGTVDTLIRDIRVLGFYIALFFAVVMFLLSRELSFIVFENEEFSSTFRWVSIALFFKILTSIHLSIIQGVRKIGKFAKVNVLSGLLSLIVLFPLYYFYGIEAIPIAIIINFFISFIVSYLFQREYVKAGFDLRISQIKVLIASNKELLKLGVLLSFTGIVTTLTVLAFQVYLSNVSSLDVVGYYVAGMAILNTYLNLVFNAMSTDYFPRLAAIHDDYIQLKKAIQQQSYITVLLMAFIVVVFILLAPFLVRLLYSKDFLAIVTMLKFGVFAMLFKSVSWCIGYTFIAKGDSKVFMKTAVIFNSIYLVMNIAGYEMYGLNGIGGAMILYFFIHLLSVYIIAHKRYKFNFDTSFLWQYAVIVMLCSGILVCSFINVSFVSILLTAVLSLALVSFVGFKLNSILDIATIVKNVKAKFL